MNPVLYILMRTDMESLNPGKAMAQAVHAGNALETHCNREIQIGLLEGDLSAEALGDAYYVWKHQTSQGFGTTIVLGGSMSLISMDVKRLQSLGYIAEIVHDPSYPIRDGDVTHLIPLDTCAYVFAPDKDDPVIRMSLSSYGLHP